MEEFSKCLAKKLLSDNISSEKYEDELEVIQYGIECILNTGIPIVLFCIISIHLHVFWEMLVWLFGFLVLRNYIGGFHASTNGKCILISSLYGIVILFLIYSLSTISLCVELFLGILFLCINSIFNPIVNDESLKYKVHSYKICGIIILLIEIAIVLILNILNLSFEVAIFLGMCSSEFLYIIELFRVSRNW